MNISFQDFDNNFLLKVASERLLETVAEACNAMSPDFKSNNPEIQWNAIKGMRNIIVHEYFSINYKVVYDTIHDQLDTLKHQLLKSI